MAPARVVREAAARSLAAVAITDHDVVSGLEEARLAGLSLNIEIVPGIELTTYWQGRSIHLLGYFIDPSAPQLNRVLQEARTAMAEHVERVLDYLDSLGHPLEPSELTKIRSRYPSGTALVLTFLRKGILRRVPRPRELLRMAGAEPRPVSAEAGIRLIQAAGGAAILAHPVRIEKDRPLLGREDLLPLVNAGLDGIEAWQIVHDVEARAHYLDLASRLDLLATGGSDCHGPGRSGMRLGSQRVPASILSDLKAVCSPRAADRN